MYATCKHLFFFPISKDKNEKLQEAVVVLRKGDRCPRLEVGFFASDCMVVFDLALVEFAFNSSMSRVEDLLRDDFDEISERDSSSRGGFRVSAQERKQYRNH